MGLSRFLKRSLAGLLVVMMVPFGALSQETATSGGTPSEAELDQMLAPIALYPDALLAQVLMAATFPNEVAEADGWLKGNPDLKGDALNDALDRMDWDMSVKALVPFPQIIAMMADRWEWMQKLGEAFRAQESAVMASVQRLRSKAYAEGNLKTTSEQKVAVKGDVYEIEPANPEVVYVPRYDPAVVYGNWWWPSYPPYAYYPVWPGVAVGVGIGIGFWGAVSVGPVWGWGWGAWHWGGGFMSVNVNRNININRNVNINRNFRTANARDVAGRGAAHRAGGGMHRGGARGTGNVGRGGNRGGGRGSGNVGRGGNRGGGRGTGNVGRGGNRGGGRGSGNVGRGGNRGGGRGTGNVGRGGNRGGGRGSGNVGRGGNRGGGHAGGARRGGGHGGGARRGGGGGHRGGGGKRGGGHGGGGRRK